MKKSNNQVPAFPPVPQSAPTPPPPKGPQPNPSVIRFRKGNQVFKPGGKNQPAVQEEDFEALGT